MHGFMRMYWAKKILEWTPRWGQMLQRRGIEWLACGGVGGAWGGMRAGRGQAGGQASKQLMLRGGNSSEACLLACLMGLLRSRNPLLSCTQQVPNTHCCHKQLPSLQWPAPAHAPAPAVCPVLPTPHPAHAHAAPRRRWRAPSTSTTSTSWTGATPTATWAACGASEACTTRCGYWWWLGKGWLPGWLALCLVFLQHCGEMLHVQAKYV
jgi:hypothetical protein